jgi:hypothetical protein
MFTNLAIPNWDHHLIEVDWGFQSQDCKAMGWGLAVDGKPNFEFSLMFCCFCCFHWSLVIIKKTKRHGKKGLPSGYLT